ncbi:hypothetical protein LCGC14_2757190 [marine sediment metagenome]|uniref:Uncharacterized protein n=1 Tax=marine sediment metagenome TaxID=412755 RepID=A0A0F8ZLY5_9ZZZZ
MPTRKETRPKYVTDFECPECGANDAVGLTSDPSRKEFNVGWCECGYTWVSAFGHMKKIKEWENI